MHKGNVGIRDLLVRWIRIGQEGISIESLLRRKNIKSIAVYGYNNIAECIIYELKDSKIEVKSLIDRKGNEITLNFPCVNAGGVNEINIDAILVLPVDDYDIIIDELRKVYSGEIITLEELLYEL